MFQLQDLALEYDTRTTISDLHQAQALMEPFSLHSPPASKICLLQCPPEKPHFAVRLASLDTSSDDATCDIPCTVEDETGTMEATLHIAAVQSLEGRLQRGTCLVLEHPVFFPIAAWHHHLIIHPKSLILSLAPGEETDEAGEAGEEAHMSLSPD